MRNLLFILLTIFSFSFASAQNATLFMEDAYGDGWNGGSVTIEGVAYTFTAGDNATENITLADPTCVYATILAGSWEAEMTFTLTVDATGDVLLDYQTNGFAPGAPATATLDIQSANCSVLGCMDALAFNYDAAADTDDGSCLFDQSYVDNNSGGDCTEFTDSIIVLNTLLDDADAQNLVLSNDLNTALDQLVTVQTSYNDLLFVYNNLQSDYDFLVVDFNLLTNNFNTLIDDYDALVVTNTNLVQANTDLSNLNDDLVDANTTLTTQNDALAANNNQLLLDLGTCQTLNIELNEDIVECTDSYNLLTSDYTAITIEYGVANDSIVTLNALLADCLDNDQVDCSGFEAQISLLEGQLITCAAGIETLNTEILGLGIEINNCTETNEDLIILNDALVNENVLLNADLVDCNSIYADLNTLYLTTSTELADCNENYGITTQLNVDLTNTNVVLNDSIVTLNTALTDCENTSADCSSQDMIIAELQGTIGAYQAEIDILTDEISSLQAQLVGANTTIDNLTASNEELNTEIDYLNGLIDGYLVQISDLQAELADCLDDHTTGIIDNDTDNKEKVLLFATNALGQRIDANTVGQVIILHYADGSSEKIVRDIR